MVKRDVVIVHVRNEEAEAYLSHRMPDNAVYAVDINSGQMESDRQQMDNANDGKCIKRQIDMIK